MREGTGLGQPAADIRIGELVDVVALSASGEDDSVPTDTMYVT